MENAIGALLVAGRMKQNFLHYNLYFMENELIAIPIEHGVEVVKWGPLGYRGRTLVPSYPNDWEKIVANANSSGKSIVSYDENPPADLLKQPCLNIPYTNISSVTIEKPYSSMDSVGYFVIILTLANSKSKEIFGVPKIGFDDAIKLLKKTPLARNLKVL